MIKNPNCCKLKDIADIVDKRKKAAAEAEIDCDACDKKCPVVKISSQISKE